MVAANLVGGCSIKHVPTMLDISLVGQTPICHTRRSSCAPGYPYLCIIRMVVFSGTYVDVTKIHTYIHIL